MNLMGLTEESMKSVVSGFLIGEASDTFFVYKNKPLQEILSILCLQYDSPWTRSSYLQSLNSFSRKNNESLQQAIQRLQTLIFAMEKDAEQGVESKVKEDLLIRSKIKSMSQPIWHKVKKQEQKELQLGEIFTTK